MQDARERARDPGHVGPYRLERRLGRGGMAEVFAASHVGAAGFERRVCIKRIIPSLAEDAEFRALFVREARVAGRLCHSNLVQVFDCVEDGETLAIVMELVDGMDLRYLLRALKARGEKLPAGLVAFVGGQVLNGLSYAHEQRVVHRDVSPHNILLSRHGEVKLADFGVAKAMLSQATRTGDLKGKLAYMSPEQAMAKPVDYRTDLYSAGLVLHELITGERYFKAESQAELIAQVVHARQPRVEGLEPQLAALIERLLAPAADDRFQSADEAMAMLPPWEVVGPSGFLELRRLVRSLIPAAEPGDELREPGRASSPSTGFPPPPDAPAGGTDVIPGAALEGRLERPVVPGPKNAPTATREDDVRQAIAMLPTDQYDRVVSGDGPAAELTATGSGAGTTDVTRRRRAAPRRGLVVAVAVAAMAAILAAGALLGASIFSSGGEPQVRGGPPPTPPAPLAPPAAASVLAPRAPGGAAPDAGVGVGEQRVAGDGAAPDGAVRAEHGSIAAPAIVAGSAPGRSEAPRPGAATAKAAGGAPDAGARQRPPHPPGGAPAHRTQDPFAVPAIGH